MYYGTGSSDTGDAKVFTVNTITGYYLNTPTPLSIVKKQTTAFVVVATFPANKSVYFLCLLVSDFKHIFTALPITKIPSQNKLWGQLLNNGY